MALPTKFAEVGVSQNSLQVAQIAQVAEMRNFYCALSLFSAIAQFALRTMLFFQLLRNLCSGITIFSACESVNLIFVAL